ncbi:ribosomal protein S5 domain 2-type protein [Gamsiella multidivaricata]|uniref:ribosomal protein S5 domain 2-type protein n=1 Tax=Gamsiella multidivaricata TaxID=101098 RepID=UPI002220B1B1|nr:ribosomal protein S5 domain 2-type protein [Gamsiella multidivaricata]KAI7828016.1 ribosomal protein S5 domain 2-type protein [Gamsiella multidivaricata]
MKELEPSTNEREFLLAALRQSARIDGRNFYDFRTLRLSFGADYGAVEVQLGNTRVMAKVSCEVIRPFQDKPTEGFLMFNTELSPMASSAFEIGRQTDEEVLVSRLIEKAMRRSRALDTEGLCIVAGEKVWSIRVDIHFLDHDGNLVDAACIAAITALLHFRRPDVTVVGEEVTIHTLEQRNPVPLSVHHIPICITFAFFDNGERVIVDPTHLEEQIKEGDMTFTLNVHKEVCALSKAGGIAMEMDQILQCSKIAVVKVTEITAQIQAALDADAKKRQISRK